MCLPRGTGGGQRLPHAAPGPQARCGLLSVSSDARLDDRGTSEGRLASRAYPRQHSSAAGQRSWAGGPRRPGAVDEAGREKGRQRTGPQPLGCWGQAQLPQALCLHPRRVQGVQRPRRPHQGGQGGPLGEGCRAGPVDGMLAIPEAAESRLPWGDLRRGGVGSVSGLRRGPARGQREMRAWEAGPARRAESACRSGWAGRGPGEDIRKGADSEVPGRGSALLFPRHRSARPPRPSGARQAALGRGGPPWEAAGYL